MKNTLPLFWSFNRIRDASMIKKEVLIWQGPFSWIGYEQINESKPIPDIAGVYLFTFEYLDGYILRSIGVTSSMKRITETFTLSKLACRLLHSWAASY